MNIHGIVHISSACLLEKREANEAENMQQEQQENSAENMDQDWPKSEQNGGGSCPGNEEVGETGWAHRVTQWFSSVRYREDNELNTIVQACPKMTII